MHDRPSWDDHWIRIAQEIAQRSTCLRKSVGAVIVRNNRILSTGYNGSPAGLAHCTEVGCLTDADGRCKRTIHAETNAILTAARHGVSIENSTLYCTVKPCEACSVTILNSGIQRVAWDEDYGTNGPITDGVHAMIEQSGIQFDQRDRRIRL